MESDAFLVLPFFLLLQSSVWSSTATLSLKDESHVERQDAESRLISELTRQHILPTSVVPLPEQEINLCFVEGTGSGFRFYADNLVLAETAFFSFSIAVVQKRLFPLQQCLLPDLIPFVFTSYQHSRGHLQTGSASLKNHTHRPVLPKNVCTAISPVPLFSFERKDFKETETLHSSTHAAVVGWGVRGRAVVLHA